MDPTGLQAHGAPGSDLRVARAAADDLTVSVERALSLTGELIRHRSLSGQETPAAECLIEHLAARLDGKAQRLVVGDGTYNVMMSWGTPAIVFTSHLDVVTAPEELFEPRFTRDGVGGRGACDAKGCIAAMVEAAALLRARGEENFALLFVVGEEKDGRGARSAAAYLGERGVEYIVNGEPTDGKLLTAHKGLVNIRLRFSGRAAHSAYPEQGIDAHEKAVRVLGKLYSAAAAREFGEDGALGATTLNAIIHAYGPDGAPLHDASIICPYAEVQLKFRSVISGGELLAALTRVSGLPEQGATGQGDGWSVEKALDPVTMLSLDGFETGVAGYSTDLPHFQILGARCVLFGPGASSLAHTREEFLSRHELAAGIVGYLRIFNQLRARSLFEEEYDAV